jgi:hypothetical protein
MIQYRKGFRALKLDDKKYLKDVQRFLEQLIYEAAREWLEAVLHAVSGAPHTVGDTFPVQTGEAKGSLAPLGSELGVSVPISPAPDRPDRSGYGEAASRYSTHIIQSAKLSYQFRWGSNVLHFQINEVSGYPNIKSAPWHVREAGDEAFQDYIERHIYDTPHIGNYLSFGPGVV